MRPAGVIVSIASVRLASASVLDTSHLATCLLHPALARRCRRPPLPARGEGGVPSAAERGLDMPRRIGAVSASGVLRAQEPWDGPCWERWGDDGVHVTPSR
jgi:hypothetical protein